MAWLTCIAGEVYLSVPHVKCGGRVAQFHATGVQIKLTLMHVSGKFT